MKKVFFFLNEDHNYIGLTIWEQKLDKIEQLMDMLLAFYQDYQIMYIKKYLSIIKDITYEEGVKMI